MSSLPKTFLTPEQYLEIERKAEFKSEYLQGEMFAMAGGSLAHNRLVFNTIAAIAPQLRAGSCQGLPSDMRVHIPATGLFTYPDVIVVCGQPQLLDGRNDTLLNPTLIIEVLSPSTEAYNRGRKFEHYRSLDSLREYLLVSSERVSVDLFTRQPDGKWLLASADRLDASLELESVGATLALADLYGGIDLTLATL
jgi:Uma2 family endonuclease